MSFLSQILGRRRDRSRYRPLYDALVGYGRDPLWYLDGQVPDTVTGRFDMIAALLSLLLIRIEGDDREAAETTVRLTELFVADMEGSIREMGIGDLVVSKHLGRMMSALGGRLGAFRGAEDLEPIVKRNIFHEAPPSEEAVRFVAARLEAFRTRLNAVPTERILAGELPRA